MILTIDVGGTKTLVATFEDNKPKIITKFSTDPDPNIFTNDLLNAIDNLPSPEAISIAIPGVVDYNGQVVKCSNLQWQNFPLKKQLKAHFSCPIFIGNDADMAALYEINNLPTVPGLGLYITVSTGIGIGLLVDGKLIGGLHRTEGGQILVPDDNNQWKIWESIASGKAIRQHFGKFAREISDDNDWNWIAKKIALGLYSLIPALEPDVIVFGGSVGQFFEKFSDHLERELRQKISSYTPIPKLVKASRPTEAVIYGCHYHATHQSSRPPRPS